MAIVQAGTRECVTEESLINATGYTLKQVQESCLLLRRRGLLTKTDRGCHKLTKAGRTALGEGVKLHSGPNEKHCGRYVRSGSLRERAWSAMRIKRRFTIDDLVMLVVKGGERDVKSNLGKYLRALARAGFVRQLPIRETPRTLSGPGCIRYALLRDSGPKPPVWRLAYGEVWDPNTEETFKLGKMTFASRKRPLQEAAQ